MTDASQSRSLTKAEIATIRAIQAGGPHAVLRSVNGIPIAARILSLRLTRTFGTPLKVRFSIFTGPNTGVQWMEMHGPPASICAVSTRALIRDSVEVLRGLGPRLDSGRAHSCFWHRTRPRNQTKPPLFMTTKPGVWGSSRDSQSGRTSKGAGAVAWLESRLSPQNGHSKPRVSRKPLSPWPWTPEPADMQAKPTPLPSLRSLLR